MPRSSGAKLWSTLNKAAARNARRMLRAVNQNLTGPMTEAIVRNAVKQSAAVTAAAGMWMHLQPGGWGVKQA